MHLQFENEVVYRGAMIGKMISIEASIMALTCTLLRMNCRTEEEFQAEVKKFDSFRFKLIKEYEGETWADYGSLDLDKLINTK